MKKNKLQKIVFYALLMLFPLQNIYADIPEEFDPNTTDTAPISDGIPYVLFITVCIVFILFRKRKLEHN